MVESSTARGAVVEALTSVSETSTPADAVAHTLLADEQNTLQAELTFLERNIEDIKELRSLAVQAPLQDADLAKLPVAHKGAVGLAVSRGERELLNRQLSAWSIYFSQHIDNLLEMYSLLEAGRVKDPRVIGIAFNMSSDILGALERTISVRLAG